MSGNGDDDKESQKAVPLDLARNQITTVRTAEGKSPLVMTSQSLRNMRVLTQGVSSSATPTPTSGQAILTVQQAVLKPDTNRAQIAGIISSTQPQSQGPGNITIQQRPAQITLSTAPLVANVPTGTSYHVPRGPAVVANLAAPRSNVTTVRAPMVVTAQSGPAHAFVRPPRTPSPAQSTAWLTTNSSNGSQIKGAPTVLSSPVRGATVTGKPQLISRTQPQTVSTIRPATILQNAITIGQQGQLHSFKPGTAGIQALGSAVTIAQVLPSRTQAVVYSANTTQFTSGTRITVANSVPTPRQTATGGRPLGQVATAKLTVPVSVTQSGARLVSPQAAVLTSGARISAVSTAQSATRLMTTQPSVTIGRLSVAAATPQVSSTNLLGQTRISALNLHSLVAVANTPQQPRAIQAQGAKVITQPAPGTIHLTSLAAAPIKTQVTTVTTSTRTISVPAALVTQRPTTVVPSQAISITKVFAQENPATVGGAAAGNAATNVFIHAPNVPNTPRRSSPSPTNLSQTTSGVVAATTTVATYTLPGGTYFYDAAGNYSVARSFGPQQTTPFAAISQSTVQQIRPALGTQVHGIVTNQPMRFNSVMVVEPNRNQIGQQQYSGAGSLQQMIELESQSLPSKTTSSPRPSILRKRDHEGSPLKAAKNLTPMLSNLSVQPAPISPPPRPDSRGNGHSSGGSTTISATSSPGLAEVNDDSMPLVPMNNKEEEEVKPPMEMSPRKKPRKQQLTGNDLDEHNDDMQFISESAIKKEQPEESDGNQSDEPRDGAPEAGQVTTVRKPASASLLNSYKQSWKATHNHYLRYSDVRPKDERRPSIMDLANQYRVQEKVNGWKIHHLSTQMEDLAEQEENVYNQLAELLKYTESQDTVKFQDVNRVNELIKGNLQRIKIINDGMIEAKSQIMKIFDHKAHVTDIINRCASKRNFKKREKS